MAIFVAIVTESWKDGGDPIETTTFQHVFRDPAKNEYLEPQQIVRCPDYVQWGPGRYCLDGLGHGRIRASAPGYSPSDFDYETYGAAINEFGVSLSRV